jgi:hypothetical protein
MQDKGFNQLPVTGNLMGNWWEWQRSACIDTVSGTVGQDDGVSSVMWSQNSAGGDDVISGDEDDVSLENLWWLFSRVIVRLRSTKGWRRMLPRRWILLAYLMKHQIKTNRRFIYD